MYIELKPCPFCHCQNRLKKVHIISRRLPFWWFIECDNCHCCGETKLFLRRAVKAWNRRAETVKEKQSDVVEVVRCKDCKYFFDECCNHEKNRVLHRVPDFGKHYSYAGRIKVEPDHYCGYGERKEGDDNA